MSGVSWAQNSSLASPLSVIFSLEEDHVVRFQHRQNICAMPVVVVRVVGFFHILISHTNVSVVVIHGLKTFWQNWYFGSQLSSHQFFFFQNAGSLLCFRFFYLFFFNSQFLSFRQAQTLVLTKICELAPLNTL